MRDGIDLTQKALMDKLAWARAQLLDSASLAQAQQAAKLVTGLVEALTAIQQLEARYA